MVGTFFLQDEKELTNPIIQVGDEIKKEIQSDILKR